MYAGIDYETYYDKDCTITDGLQNYLKHDNFDAYMVSIYCDDNFAWVGHPKDAPWDKLEGVIALSHNRGFDEPVHDHLISTGVIPQLNLKSGTAPQIWLLTQDIRDR